MRILTIASLAILTALAASPEASAQLADSSGAYLGLGGGYSNSTGLIGPALAVGYRQQNGLEYGIGLSFDSRPGTENLSYSSTSIGATLGYGAALNSKAAFRAEGTVAYASTAYLNRLSGEERRIDGTALAFDANARVSREVLRLGSVRLSPSIGVYASGYDRLTTYSTGLNADLIGSDLDAGLQVGLPISFRLFGADVTLPLQTRLSIFRNRPYAGQPWSPSTGIRVDF